MKAFAQASICCLGGPVLSSGSATDGQGGIVVATAFLSGSTRSPVWVERLTWGWSGVQPPNAT